MVRVTLADGSVREFSLPAGSTAAELKQVIVNNESIDMRPPLELINLNDGVTLADHDLIGDLQPLRVSSVAGPAHEQNVFSSINARFSAFGLRKVKITLTDGTVIKLPVESGTTIAELKKYIVHHEPQISEFDDLDNLDNLSLFTSYGSKLVDQEEIHESRSLYVAITRGTHMSHYPFRDSGNSSLNASRNSSSPILSRSSSSSGKVGSITLDIPSHGHIIDVSSSEYMFLSSTSDPSKGSFAFSPVLARRFQSLGIPITLDNSAIRPDVSASNSSNAGVHEIPAAFTEDPTMAANVDNAGANGDNAGANANNDGFNFAFNLNNANGHFVVRLNGADMHRVVDGVKRLFHRARESLYQLDVTVVVKTLIKLFCIGELCFFIIDSNFNIVIKTLIIGLAILLYCFPGIIIPLQDLVPASFFPHNLPMPPQLQLDFTGDPAEAGGDASMSADEVDQIIFDSIDKDFRSRRSFTRNTADMLILFGLTFIPNYYKQWKEQDDERIGAYVDAIKKARADYRARIAG